ncbi:hypothetical protein AGABI2DRAFT_185799 [Agaricus bisporus var. bisporus H97]|uniref:hypothetical protein n=1 Tax=Agaricus bisporus var. bisporus (strain H97 / ATCC MYA-4626 / FGSC 10389) TaxID=936046 RepID=UPI00029F6C9F|nr:hypothetical protein AGABI2DRAFT_185799 [Agaricus bisporus var. bisporus H97]EKV46358.1 hypothetical protein AGABI2DRAFT_185799 [Agaricus bisporus var. bisporus H97]
MSDGPRLRQTWYNALNDAEAHFRQLLTSTDWKRISTAPGSLNKKGKGRVSIVPELTDVVVHRHAGVAGGDPVYRMLLDVAVGEENVSLESWKAVLTTPELRQEWDPAVEEARLLEMFDHRTRISKTNFTLGWPANPRDAVTIARLFHDANTIIDISTSLPRSLDEPAYLRPSPPYVRSYEKLFAWCIQLVQPQSDKDDPTKKKPARLRITCFWQHDFKAIWAFNSSSSLAQQLSTMTLSLFKTVVKRGNRVAKLSGYGNGVSVDRIRYQIDREALDLEYAIIPEDDEHSMPIEQGQGMEEVLSLREQRRLTRSIECILPSLEGWEVQVTTRASSDEVERLPWSANVLRTNSSTSPSRDQIILRVTHTALPDAYSVLKVKITVEVSAASRGVRLNGIPKAIVEAEERDPFSHFMSPTMLQDIASTADLSATTSVGTASSVNSASSSVTQLNRSTPERSAASAKSILSRVRRNYIYFSSLLQEPEAKWRRTTEGRGVSITQLDSIDPTLVVYRAEATFVGVNLWDLYAAVVTPGARQFWDKQHEDGVLLEDVNELTELWHYKTKPAWPVNGRDSVVLKTVYKSPNAIHVFSFSADEPHLFPNVPIPEPNIIRTQVDLQGWSIEALSPTTTLLTLLEQSDPKGWTNKTSIPTQMINTLAGIGDFAIKCGGPPTVTRLAGAKINEVRYDYEKVSFRVEYEAYSDSHSPAIELELRCDIDTWAASLDIIVDPPPQVITCLRRHRLSVEGGGLWLTLGHDAMFMDDERLQAIIRKAPGKEKGLVMVNGAKIHVDGEEMSEQEIKTLTKQKRVKPVRIPLDQPPVMGNIKKKNAEWGDGGNGGGGDGNSSGGASPLMENKPVDKAINTWASAPKVSSPLTRFLNYYVDQATTTTQQAVAAMTPTGASGETNVTLSSSKVPLQYALEAFSWVQDTHSSSSSSLGSGSTSTASLSPSLLSPSLSGSNSSNTNNNDWTLVSEKPFPTHRKLVPEVSSIIPVYKGSKVIEGFSSDELIPLIVHSECRKKWDDRVGDFKLLESYGGGCWTGFGVEKLGVFPFRDRGFYVASVVVVRGGGGGGILGPGLSRVGSTNVSDETRGGNGRGGSDRVVPSSGTGLHVGGVDHSSTNSRRAIYYVSASFNPESLSSSASQTYVSSKCNPNSLPIGRIHIDAWVLETLDPYTKENYMIPSTRCTRYISMDYAGSIPLAVNYMINSSIIPKSIQGLENFIKTMKEAKPFLPVLRLPKTAMVVGNVGRKEEEMFVGLKNMAWKLRKRDESRLVVWERFSLEERVLSCCVEVELDKEFVEKVRNGIGSGGNGNGNEELEDATPRPRTAIPLKIASPMEKEDSEATITTSSSSPTSSDTSSISSTSFPIRQYPQRTRTVSSTATISPIYAAAASAFEDQRRGRSVSTFITREEMMRPASLPSASSRRSTVMNDLVVMELVVDKKMYPEGYEVRVGSRMKKDVKIGKDGGFIPLEGIESNMTSSVLPLKYSVFAMPLSAMHSSGEAGTRHLVRMVLPTAQIEKMMMMMGAGFGEVRDPLTGEMRKTPSAAAAENKQPQWWSDMLEFGGAVVWVEVRPAKTIVSSVSSGARGSTSKGSLKKKSKGRGEVVMVNETEVVVVNEAEALTDLGREELMDDKVSKMSVISRVPNDAEALPEELKTPIGITHDLCDLTSSASLEASGSSVSDGKDEKGGGTEGKKKDDNFPGEESPKTMGEEESQPHVSRVASGGGGGASGGLLGFLKNPLLARWGAMVDVDKREGSELTVPGGIGEEMGVWREVKEGEGRRGALSRLIIVAVIAFLLGSLLRSLISPADFVYIGEARPEGEGGGGWRELRRLVEVKCVFGGWDVHIATVP